MSLDNFLYALLEDKEIHSFNVEIVPDNPLNGSSSNLFLDDENSKPRKCKWNRMKRLDSDSFLIKPGRRASLTAGPEPNMSRCSNSDTMLLRMPQRFKSPEQTMKKPVLRGSGGAKNATWDSLDSSQATTKNIDSSRLRNMLLVTPDMKLGQTRTTSGPTSPKDAMLFGLQGVPSSSNSSSKSRSQTSLSKNTLLDIRSSSRSSPHDDPMKSFGLSSKKTGMSRSNNSMSGLSRSGQSLNSQSGGNARW